MNDQNNSSAPSEQQQPVQIGELAVGDTVRTLDVDWAADEDYAHKDGTVERLDPDGMEGTVEVRFSDGDGVVCLYRQLAKITPTAQPLPDRVQGGLTLTDEQIESLVPWQEDRYGDAFFSRVEFARAVERAILSRQSATPANAAAANGDGTSDKADEKPLGPCECAPIQRRNCAYCAGYGKTALARKEGEEIGK